MKIKTRFNVGDKVYVKDILGNPAEASIDKIIIIVRKGKSGNAISSQSYEVLIKGYDYPKTKKAEEIYTAKSDIIAEKIAEKRKQIEIIEAGIAELEGME